MSWPLRLFLAVIVLLLSVDASMARKLALIVGNDSYENVPDLERARSDAKGYAEFFSAQGFAVTLASDQDFHAMAETLSNFYDSIAPGDTVVFEYSGHGWSDGAQNYLIPTNVRANVSPTLLAAESFALKNGVSGIIDQITAREPALVVAIIDACRDNPFLRTDATRSVGLQRGLALISPGAGSFLAFSAGEGQTALDRLSPEDPAEFSVFTRYFLAELALPQDLQTAFKATQIKVNAAAQTVGHPQRPSYYDETLGSICLTEACTLRESFAGPPAPDPIEAARLEWQDFKDSQSVDALAAFIQRHKNTPYEILARERLARLTAQPPVDPPKPPETDGASAKLHVGRAGTIVAWRLDLAFGGDCEVDHKLRLTPPAGDSLTIDLKGTGRCGAPGNKTYLATSLPDDALIGTSAPGDWQFTLLDDLKATQDTPLVRAWLRLTITREGQQGQELIELDGRKLRRAGASK